MNTPQNQSTAIVVGVDGSEASRDALRWAAQQAALTGAHLRVVMAWHIAQRVLAAPPRGHRPRTGNARRPRQDPPRNARGHTDNIGEHGGRRRPPRPSPDRPIPRRRPACRRQPWPRRVHGDAPRIRERTLCLSRRLPRRRRTTQDPRRVTTQRLRSPMRWGHGHGGRRSSSDDRHRPTAQPPDRPTAPSATGCWEPGGTCQPWRRSPVRCYLGASAARRRLPELCGRQHC